MPITSSVGSGGVNRRADVMRVQDYLNIARQQNRLPPIAVDGIVGPETVGAITAFQNRNTRVVDGRIDPLGPTIAVLERSVATIVEANLRKEMLQVLDDLDQQLARKGYRLPNRLDAKFQSIRQYVRSFRAGPSIATGNVSTLQLAFFPATSRPAIVFTAAPALAAGAAAEALMLALLATMALLVLIMLMPHISRSVEEILRKIQVLMAQLLDTVNEAVEGIEDLIRRNARAGMRCSAEIIAFRELTRQLTDALTSPRPVDPVAQQQQVIRTSNLFKQWQQALQALLSCLISAGAT
jgi:hypothetical protein